MESVENPLKSMSSSSKRHKCAACFKQYKIKEHLIEHMKTSYHSLHQPKCGVCQKHCKSFESLREHTTGEYYYYCSYDIIRLRLITMLVDHIIYVEKPRPTAENKLFRSFLHKRLWALYGNFWNSILLGEHQRICCLPAPAPQGPCAESQIYDPPLIIENGHESHPEAVAIDCGIVGGGSDGTLDLCVRVCLVNEEEKLIFHTYVMPQIPVTNYRYEITGITEDHLRDAMPLKEVQDKILHILHNGESIGILRLNGGKARVLVGHALEHDLYCLRMNYPDHMLRDTAKYPPLMKTNLVSHSLKYLVKTYLGYDIQSELHDPYQNCLCNEVI